MKYFKIFLIIFLSMASLGAARSEKAAYVRSLISGDPVIRDVVQKAPFYQQTVEAYLYRISIDDDPQPILREFAANLRHYEPGLDIQKYISQRSGLNKPAFFKANGNHSAKNPINSILASAKRVNDTDKNCWQVAFAIDESSGLILAVWQDERTGADNPDIYGQFFDLSLYPLGQNFRVHSDNSGAAQSNPSVAAKSDGGFVVVWEDYRYSNAAIYLRCFDALRNPVGNDSIVFSEPQYPQLSPDVAADGEGNFTVVWLQNEDFDFNVYARKFTNSQAPVGPAFKINSDEGGFQWFPTIASAQTGESLIAWEDKRNGNSDIYGQRLRADGSKRASNFQISDDAGSDTQWRPFAASASGRFIVTWEDYRDDPNAIYAQWLDTSLLLDGENLCVDDANGQGVKEYPSVALNSGGESLFCWQDSRNGNYDLFARRFGIDKTPQNLLQITGGETEGDQTLGRVGVAGTLATFFFLDKNPADDWQNVFADQYDWTSLPVELSSFKAQVNGNKVLLKWSSASETNNLGFSIQRKSGQNEFKNVGFVKGNGTTNSSNQYQYDDADLLPGHYVFRLKQIDFDGGYFFSESIDVIVNLPQKFSLMQNYPNPFNGGTSIEYALPKSSRVRLEIVNLQGRVVKSLLDREQEGGIHRVYWDGKDDAGYEVATGLYFYHLKTGDFTDAKKLVLSR